MEAVQLFFGRAVCVSCRCLTTAATRSFFHLERRAALFLRKKQKQNQTSSMSFRADPGPMAWNFNGNGRARQTHVLMMPACDAFPASSATLLPINLGIRQQVN